MGAENNRQPKSPAHLKSSLYRFARARVDLYDIIDNKGTNLFHNRLKDSIGTPQYPQVAREVAALRPICADRASAALNGLEAREAENRRQMRESAHAIEDAAQLFRQGQVLLESHGISPDEFSFRNPLFFNRGLGNEENAPAKKQILGETAVLALPAAQPTEKHNNQASQESSSNAQVTETAPVINPNTFSGLTTEIQPPSLSQTQELQIDDKEVAQMTQEVMSRYPEITHIPRDVLRLIVEGHFKKEMASRDAIARSVWGKNTDATRANLYTALWTMKRKLEDRLDIQKIADKGEEPRYDFVEKDVSPMPSPQLVDTNTPPESISEPEPSINGTPETQRQSVDRDSSFSYSRGSYADKVLKRRPESQPVTHASPGAQARQETAPASTPQSADIYPSKDTVREMIRNSRIQHGGNLAENLQLQKSKEPPVAAQLAAHSENNILYLKQPILSNESRATVAQALLAAVRDIPQRPLPDRTEMEISEIEVYAACAVARALREDRVKGYTDFFRDIGIDTSERPKNGLSLSEKFNVIVSNLRDSLDPESRNAVKTLEGMKIALDSFNEKFPWAVKNPSLVSPGAQEALALFLTILKQAQGGFNYNHFARMSGLYWERLQK